MSNVNNPIFLSPSQTAKLLGVSERSIRRAIKDNDLKAEVVNARYQIDFGDALIWSEGLPNRTRKRDTEGIGQYVKEWEF